MKMIDKVLDFVKGNSNIQLESPRKRFFGGKSRKAQRFKLFLDRDADKVIFEFESGTRLGIEIWRIVKAIEFLRNHSNVVEIGARISEEYPRQSLEGYLKETAKRTYGRKTDTKTAPHIVDLLVMSGIAELSYAKSSSGRRVQGVKLK